MDTSKATQKAMEAIQTSDDPFLAAKARAVLRAWIETKGDRFSAARVLDVESEFRFDLLNPETQAASRSFVVAGKIDADLIEGGFEKVLEHKTTSESLEPDSFYWDRLEMNVQVSQYFVARLAEGRGPQSVLYNVMARPAYRPSMIPELDEDGLKVFTDAEGNRARNKDGKPRQSPAEGLTLRARQETPEEFEARVYAEVSAAPERFFAVREVARLDSQVLEYLRDAWILSQEILMKRREGYWRREPNACRSLAGNCPFVPLCAGRATVDGIQFRHKDFFHPELENGGEATDKRQLMTATRMGELGRCPRRHWYLFEEGIEAVREETEPLRYGQMVHQALETWFKAIKEEQSNEQSA